MSVWANDDNGNNGQSQFQFFSIFFLLLCSPRWRDETTTKKCVLHSCVIKMSNKDITIIWRWRSSRNCGKKKWQSDTTFSEISNRIELWIWKVIEINRFWPSSSSASAVWCNLSGDSWHHDTMGEAKNFNCQFSDCCSIHARKKKTMCLKLKTS